VSGKSNRVFTRTLTPYTSVSGSRVDSLLNSTGVILKKLTVSHLVK
jgi:hypothetical protein